MVSFDAIPLNPDFLKTKAQGRRELPPHIREILKGKKIFLVGKEDDL